MARKPKYQGRPTFQFHPETMIQNTASSNYIPRGHVIDAEDLFTYLRAAEMSEGQLEEAVHLLIGVLAEGLR
tara:strand:+ start:259 stop:474 length:216 start_codon:yes stop_codon:yes gene_type:complete